MLFASRRSVVHLPISRVTTTIMAANHHWTPSAYPYPSARRSDASTVYASKAHGQVVVPEPYDWLETPPSQSSETAAWTKAQSEYTARFVAQCKDKPALQERLKLNWDYARTSAPSLKPDGRYYYSYNAGLAPQSQIYRATREQVDAAQKSPSKEPVGELFFDTNVLSSDGTVALKWTSFSHSGKYMAYGISQSGSDWFRIFLRSTEQPMLSRSEGTDVGGDGHMPDALDHIKFSGITWTHDDRGFFYQRFPATEHEDKGTETDANQDAQLYYHRLGTPQAEDILVVDSDPVTRSSMWHCDVTDDGQWLILANSKDTDNKMRYYAASLADGVSSRMAWIPISSDFAFMLDYIANDNTRFYMLSNKDAPNYRIVSFELDPTKARVVDHVSQLTGGISSFTDIVPEDPQAILTTAAVLDHNKLLAVYSRDVKDELWVFDLTTGDRITRLLPELVGTIAQLTGRRDHRESFVSSVSFANPGRVDRVSWEGLERTDRAAPPASVTEYATTHVAGIDANDYISTQVFVTSKDGTRVPMFLTHAKDTPLDGSAPALLYFYGGFNIPITPVFSPSMMTWVASYRGVLAFVNARGGGEYGDKWHDAGRLFHKQNVFDDVLAAAKWLHESKYARKGHITICGGSNGGMGVGAVVNQCTDEHGIGAAIADVGVHDMIKFPLWTIGKAWTADYGNPQEDGAAFDYNMTYSPLHTVRANKTYPTVILACADHDDRVVPAHSFKLAAEMQHTLAINANPILLRVDLQAGHGEGKSTQKRMEEAAEKYAIVAHVLGLPLTP
ncbi:prolyl oligopeptidase [Malassezia arunalokei]|uniref:Prolyl endopeptidase n=1 Tax=Malassezia arunalokei TaxID=1514897 RepID=A0AAJ5Z4H7_9BASI|nr:prolyl oligopeptidase [Malassezia arunalokei]